MQFAHFFGENAAHIVLTNNMGNADGFILNPFTHQVFSELNVVHNLECYVA